MERMFPGACGGGCPSFGEAQERCTAAVTTQVLERLPRRALRSSLPGARATIYSCDARCSDPFHKLFSITMHVLRFGPIVKNSAAAWTAYSEDRAIRRVFPFL